jgi:hypothetical protein
MRSTTKCLISFTYSIFCHSLWLQAARPLSLAVVICLNVYHDHCEVETNDSNHFKLQTTSAASREFVQAVYLAHIVTFVQRLVTWFFCWFLVFVGFWLAQCWVTFVGWPLVWPTLVTFFIMAFVLANVWSFLLLIFEFEYRVHVCFYG